MSKSRRVHARNTTLAPTLLIHQSKPRKYATTARASACTAVLPVTPVGTSQRLNAEAVTGLGDIFQPTASARSQHQMRCKLCKCARRRMTNAAGRAGQHDNAPLGVVVGVDMVCRVCGFRR